LTGNEATLKKSNLVSVFLFKLDFGTILVIIQGKLQPDDLFLLCSVGLTDMLTDEKISATIGLEDSLENNAQALIDLADEAGDITVALVQVIAN
jgi:serine/threonine protein phosphatase PrpC